MKRIIAPNQVPPGGNYRYVQPETGMEFLGQTPGVVFKKVRDHRIANNIPVRHMEQQVIDQFCGAQPDWCEDVDPDTGKPTPWEMAQRFTRAMVRWATDGFRVVATEKYQARRNICEGCQYWRGEGTEPGTGRCGKCGCSGLKLFLATERCPDGKWEAQA